MHNLGYIVIFCVLSHNVVYNTVIMVSMLVNIATAENSLKVIRNPDLSISLTYINIAIIHSFIFKKTFVLVLGFLVAHVGKIFIFYAQKDLYLGLNPTKLLLAPD